ncbi:MAG: hypothetical protein ABR514_11885 [Chthoniobacterales bacterium]
MPSDSRAFEFGSGRSTHALRRAFPAVFSLEHSADWLDRTEDTSVAAVYDRRTNSPDSAPPPQRASDESAVIPLKRCWNRLRLVESFKLAKHPHILAHLDQARLILVDSPPNPAKREHALFLALRHAPIGAVIVLDDLEIRATSRFAHRLARQNAKRFRFWRLNIDHQLGVFLKLRPGRLRSRPTLTEFVGTWLRV